MAEPSQAKIPRLTLDREDDNIDRLTPLPQCVLLLILSFLSLKEAAATSVLSTSWRDLFLQLPNIDFNFSVDGAHLIEHSRSFHRFTVFAKRVLQERSQEIPITILKLHVRRFTERFRLDLKSLWECMAAAISTFKVKELEINIDSINTRALSSSIVIPPAMFSSETLTDLRLAFVVGWDVPESVWLPKLRYANFSPFRLEDENSIQRFLNGCPMLENFVLELRVSEDVDETQEDVDETQVKTLCMSSSSLKLLKVIWEEGDDKLYMNFTVKSESLESLTLYLKGGDKVNMDAPNLKYLSITGQVFEFNGNQSFVSIHEAVIDIECPSYFTDTINLFSPRSVSRFFNGLRNVRLLSLSEIMMKALYASRMVISTFRNLFKIRLTPRYCQIIPRTWTAEVLFKLLGSCPNLKVLAFDQVSNNYFAEDVQFENVFPLAVVEHLKEIEISNFKCGEIEYKLVDFFLKNGQSLEIISLTKENRMENEWKQKQLKRILSFKTCSDCEIIFN